MTLGYVHIRIVKKRVRRILPCFLFLVQTSCTESFPIETIEFENILIVESTLTDEMKRQEVRLSRTIGLEEFGPDIVDNAEVRIEDSDGTVFTFSHDAETQTYLSDIEFQAEQNTQYTLKIRTSDGRGYASKVVETPPKAPIERVYAEFVSEAGKEGVQVFIDSDDAMGGAKNFRYEYEETYKVQLPANAKFDWEIVNYSDFTQTGTLVLTPRDWTDEEFCYPTNGSKGIIQTSTSELDENRVVRFPIRFIDKVDPVLRRRYSILVKQYVQSPEAQIFYQVLKDLGSVESLLAQGQPGYVQGNIVSDTDADEKVLGYFGASSVSSQRIYFDHKDFGLDLPPYFVECDWLISNEIRFHELKRLLEFENYQIIFTHDIVQGPHLLTQSECSNCTTYTTHIKPDFWEDGP
ncbi:MAG: DUF4249 domain-containing protein [Maribacter sp.]|nr:DUF4249 domain-containing protein [Maribacter sp.]